MDIGYFDTASTGEWDVQNPAAKQHRGAAHSDVTCCGSDAHPYKEPLKEGKIGSQPSVWRAKRERRCKCDVG